MTTEEFSLPLSIKEAGAKLRDGTLTAVALTEAVYARADRYDKELGVFLTRFDEAALERAAAADDELAAGRDRGPLHGIPLGIKDIIATREAPTTGQSLVLDRSWGADKDAPVISRLRDAGAVLVGKTTTLEFAHGTPDATKPFPLPRNPWDTRRWTGGSSSGTGGGVAAGFFLGGLGTDTGGSIRIPSALCGISGLMPTYGRVPKSGCLPLGYSLDHVGPMARTAEDCAAILQVLAGYHPSDPSCIDVEVPEYSATANGSLEGLRIGVHPHQHSPAGMDDNVRPAFDQAIGVLRGLGAEIVEIDIPLYREMSLIVGITRFAEAFAYHRNDLQAKWSDYSATARVNFSRGALMSGADYVQAQRVRRVAQRHLAALFEQVDVIAGWTNSSGAPFYFDPPGAVALDSPAFAPMLNTEYWSPTGNPVLVVPMGFTTDGMPLSMQIGGRPFEEAVLVRVGAAFQRATAWHEALPPL
jgi:aspartyl-tRNA(Asn)/glutamyl-tRNA(Gln) amidotransferase subunit A